MPTPAQVDVGLLLRQKNFSAGIRIMLYESPHSHHGRWPILIQSIYEATCGSFSPQEPNSLLFLPPYT